MIWLKVEWRDAASESAMAWDSRIVISHSVGFVVTEETVPLWWYTAFAERILSRKLSLIGTDNYMQPQQQLLLIGDNWWWTTNKVP